jgi:transcriptional regulator with XRE-family HTH domain
MENTGDITDSIQSQIKRTPILNVTERRIKMAVQSVIEKGYTQQNIADELHISRSLVAMAATGKRKIPKECEPALARMCHRAALKIASEQSGGYISNIYDTYSNLDIHPSALREMALVEITEAKQALEALILVRMDPQKKKELIEETLMQLEDVSEVIDGLKGVYAEEFGVNLPELNKKRRELIKRGER